MNSSEPTYQDLLNRIEELEMENKKLRNQFSASNMDNSFINQMNEEILERNAKYETIFQKSQIIALIINPENGNVIDASSKAIEFYGFTEDQLLKMSIYELDVQNREISKDFLKFTHENLQQNYLGKHRKANGDIVDVEIFASLLKTKKESYFYFVVFDITEQNRMNQELLNAKSNAENNEKHLRTIINTLPDLIWLKDAKGVYLNCNNRFEDFFGAKEHEIVGKSDYDFMSSELAYIFREYDQNAIKAGQPTMNEEEITFANDGHKEFLETLKTPLYDKNNQLIGVLGIGRDITIRKKNEMELILAKEHAEKMSKKLTEAENQLKLKLENILSPNHTLENITLTDLIDLDLLQKIQDSFVKATNVASIITDLNGSPITKPSNFSGVCDIIRKTEKGRQNCYKSDKIIGLKAGQEKQPFYQKCMSCGFIDAGAPIIVAGKQVAIWMIGQSNTGDVDNQRIINYSIEIGADTDKMLSEYEKIQNMDLQQFENVTSFLWIMAQELSELAYNNIQLSKNLEERKQYEKKLLSAIEKAEENEQKFKLMIDNSPDLIIIQNLAGESTFISHQVERITGYSANELIGQSIPLDKIYPDDIEKCSLGFENLKNGKNIVNIEYRFIKRTGEIIWVQHSANIIYVDKIPKGFQSNIRDITDRKQSEQAVRLRESYLSAIFDNLPGLVWLKDIESRFLSVNKIFADACGIDNPEDLNGKSDFDIWPNDLSIQYIEDDKKVISSGKPIITEEYIGNSGIYKWFETHKTPVIDKDGVIIGSTGFAFDITNRKKTEEDLKNAKEKAEESDQLKTAFLQNMSHEIRTPLNAIHGFSGLLNKPGLTEEKRNSFVSIIQNSSNQLVSIVTDILTISSLETKQEKINISKICLNNIIIELLEIFKQQAENQNISLFTKQQLTDYQSEIYTDRTKITQILSNLLSNALKFTRQGFIEFGYNLIDNFLEFYVKDCGIGIKPEYHEKIFERFRQADHSINKSYGGTGLGLAISKAFVELLGGKIWVQSEPEKGSTFYFTIPYRPVNEFNKSSFKTNQNFDEKTIIIAEDEEYNFLLIEELLHDSDIKLIHTKNGKETIEVFKSNQNTAMILMDIKMPIMDGHEAAKIIKSINPGITIIAQSAYALEHERAKYSDIFDDYITKPINGNELKQMVFKSINKEKVK